VPTFFDEMGENLKKKTKSKMSGGIPRHPREKRDKEDKNNEARVVD